MAMSSTRSIVSEHLRLKGRRGSTSRLTLAEVERLFEAYQINPTISYVMNACGVGYPTAQRYVQQGDPLRGVEAFETRLERLQAITAAKADERASTDRANLSLGLEQLYRAMLQKIAVFDQVTGEIVDLNVTPDFRDVVEVGRFLQVLRGGADARTDHVHKFKTLSNDELRAVIKGARRAAGLPAPETFIDAETSPVLELPAADEHAEEEY